MQASLLKNSYDSLSGSREPITDGYGEFLLYAADGAPLEKEIFIQAWSICNFYAHHPQEGAERASLCVNREIRRIQPNLVAVFVPRTLYELGYISAVIQEERKGYCRGEDWARFLPPEEESYLDWAKGWVKWSLERVGMIKPDEYSLLRKDLRSKIDTCWHLIDSTDKMPLSDDDPVTQHLAFRMNQYLVVEFAIQRQTLSGRKIVALTERYIERLKAQTVTHSTRVFQGVLGNHFREAFCIDEERKANILRNAIALECHQVAVNAFILYRSGNMTRPSIYNEAEVDLLHNHSYSYGTSLLAGCVRDTTANVFYYAVAEHRDTFAIVVPGKDYRDSPFVVPQRSAILQLLSTGEQFHARSKFSRRVEEGYYASGVWMTQEHAEYSKSLECDQSLEELSQAITHYHRRAYLLSP